MFAQLGKIFAEGHSPEFAGGSPVAGGALGHLRVVEDIAVKSAPGRRLFRRAPVPRRDILKQCPRLAHGVANPVGNLIDRSVVEFPGPENQGGARW